MAPFDEAAEIYLASELLPIPVRGKNPPASGTTGYNGTVTLEKVNAWLHSDDKVRATAGRGAGYDNIAIRHQLTVAIDVDHGYGDKNGAEQLAAYAAEHGLPPLPATWSSTARGDDSPSRQYLYRVSADIRFTTKPCKAVELCTWHHRYTVVWPSVHPDTGSVYSWYEPGADGVPPAWGARTSRIPRADMLAELPPEWFEAMRGNDANADRSVETMGVAELVATFADGEPDGLVRTVMAKWANPKQHVGHDEAKDALVHAFMLGREGHRGVRELLDLIWRRYTAYLAEARPRQAAFEARSLVAATATIAQQKPIQRTAGRIVFPTMGEPVPPQVAEQPMADDEDVEVYLATFTAFRNPRRLGQRTAWMRDEPVSRLPYHAVRLVVESIEGQYPAEHAVKALLQGYRHHGVTDADTPKTILKLALGAVLNDAKVSA